MLWEFIGNGGITSQSDNLYVPALLRRGKQPQHQMDEYFGRPHSPYQHWSYEFTHIAAGNRKFPVHSLDLYWLSGILVSVSSSGVDVQLYYFFYLDAMWELVVNVTPWSFYPPERKPVPVSKEAGWDPGLVWTGAENVASTGIRSPDRPARSESLYRLRHAGPL
jgi:hypothetical protein